MKGKQQQDFRVEKIHPLWDSVNMALEQHP